jgi:hypothetical protein
MKIPDMVIKESWFKQRFFYVSLIFPFYYVIMYYIIL